MSIEVGTFAQNTRGCRDDLRRAAVLNRLSVAAVLAVKTRPFLRRRRDSFRHVTKTKVFVLNRRLIRMQIHPDDVGKSARRI
jgi:hypothetical protein